MKRLSKLLLCLLLLAPAGLRGDGGFIAEMAITKVTVPDQRALIHYRDGKETLVIDTSVASGSTNLAWILPLPSPPEIEAATSGLFPTLEILFSPRIIHDPGRSIVFMTAFFGSAAFVVIALFRKHPRRVEFAVLFAILFLLSGLLLPALSTAGGSVVAASNTVQVLATSKVGSFDTVTLRGKTGDSVLNWLHENGFPVSTAHRPVIESYAQEGWVFVAARIIKPTDQTVVRVHPMTFRFATQRAVYPLRLTAIGNDACTFELFVFGEQQAAIPGWKVNRSDIAVEGEDHWRNYLPRNGITVGHEYLQSIVKAGEIGTKLSARLSPEGMSKDAYIDWRTPKQFKPTVFTEKGAKTVLLNSWLCFGIVEGILVYATGGTSLIKRIGVNRTWLFAMLSATILAVPAYQLMPRIEVTSGHLTTLRTKFVHDQLLTTLHTEWLAHTRASANQDTAKASLEDIRKLIAKTTTAKPGYTNYILGAPFLEQDCPGGYTLEQTPDGVRYRVHDLTGTPVVHFPLTDRDGKWLE